MAYITKEKPDDNVYPYTSMEDLRLYDFGSIFLTECGFMYVLVADKVGDRALAMVGESYIDLSAALEWPMRKAPSGTSFTAVSSC